jgi:transposase
MFMSTLADRVQHVIGVDTHLRSHTAAVLNSTGGLLESLQIEASQDGYGELLELAARTAPGGRVWAVEGSRSYGAALTAFLLSLGETVCEVDRPKRPPRRHGKSDQLDAVRAGREALAKSELALPRASGTREALRIASNCRRELLCERTRAMNQLRDLVVTAPERIAAGLRRRDRRSHSLERLTMLCLALEPAKAGSLEDHIRLEAMQRTARRIVDLKREADYYQRQMLPLIQELAPGLLELPGVGPATAATVLVAYSHRGRFRSEAAFASLAGVAPIPASSGEQQRHRLNRGGDRELNQALDYIVKNRLRYHPETIAYMTRHRGGHRTDRDLRRVLKRYLARSLFRFLESLDLA